MTNAQHTPGPWIRHNRFIIEGSAKDTFLHDDNAHYICSFGGMAYKNEANRNLIAAAPDMKCALSNERDGVIESIEHALRWIKADLKIIEARCDREGVKGAHKDCDMQNLNTAIANLERAECKARAALAKAEGGSK